MCEVLRRRKVSVRQEGAPPQQTGSLRRSSALCCGGNPPNHTRTADFCSPTHTAASMREVHKHAMKATQTHQFPAMGRALIALLVATSVCSVAGEWQWNGWRWFWPSDAPQGATPTPGEPRYSTDPSPQPSPKTSSPSPSQQPVPIPRSSPNAQGYGNWVTARATRYAPKPHAVMLPVAQGRTHAVRILACACV